MNNKKIKLIVPTLNEEQTIRKVITDAKEFDIEIIVIDGNSTDQTVQIAKGLDVPVWIQEGKGKGNAIIQAFQRLSLEENQDIIVLIDGDETYDIKRIESLCKPIIDGLADMVIGDRLKGNREEGSISRVNMIGNYVFSILSSILYWLPLIDTQTGYRAFTPNLVKDLAPILSSSGFEIETEINIITKKLGYKIKSIPSDYFCRPKGSETKLSPLKTGSRILKKLFVLKFKRVKKSKLPLE